MLNRTYKVEFKDISSLGARKQLKGTNAFCRKRRARGIASHGAVTHYLALLLF